MLSCALQLAVLRVALLDEMDLKQEVDADPEKSSVANETWIVF
jgi:hypothetical protein